MVTICTTRFHIQQLYVLPSQYIYVFCMELTDAKLGTEDTPVRGQQFKANTVCTSITISSHAVRISFKTDNKNMAWPHLVSLLHVNILLVRCQRGSV